jgi:hypothetical protein
MAVKIDRERHATDVIEIVLFVVMGVSGLLFLSIAGL